MDSWLAVVRREIEALGGKKHTSETGKPKPDEKVMQLRAQPSHRYLVHRDLDKFSNPNTPLSPTFAPPWKTGSQLEQNPEEVVIALEERRPSIIRPSTGHRSITNSVASHDGRQLESLRDSTNRLSYMSSGQRTLITSQGSTPATSPMRESFSTFDDLPLKLSTEDIRPRPNAAAINERRRSMQTMSIQVLETQAPKKFRPHSTNGGPSRPIRPQSPTTPNFSVPNFSNKRHSAMKSPTTKTLVKDSQIPNIVTTTPKGSRESMLKGTRKPPPLALNVTRPLSPVRDSPSPGSQPLVFTPTASAFKKIEQMKQSVVDIPARSPGPNSPTSPSPTKMRPPRRSSLMPLRSEETAHIEFEFPRRLSSMQMLHIAFEKRTDGPLRPAPLPPAALTMELPESAYLQDIEIREELKQGMREARIEKEKEKATLSTLPSLPVITSTKNKLRRPISMQIRPPSSTPHQTPKSSPRLPILSPSQSSSSTLRTPNTASSSALGNGYQEATAIATSPISMTLLSPSLQRLRLEGNSKTLVNRRSLPTLVNGPPPAPPPACALPPIPPPGSAGLKGAQSQMGLRNSVQI